MLLSSFLLRILMSVSILLGLLETVPRLIKAYLLYNFEDRGIRLLEVGREHLQGRNHISPTPITPQDISCDHIPSADSPHSW